MDDLEKVLDSLMADSSDPFFSDMNKREYKTRYSDTKISIGKNILGDEQYLKLDPKNTTRTIALAPTGGGKTVLLKRSLCSVASVTKQHQVNYKMVNKPRYSSAILVDPKGEFTECAEPVDEEYGHLLRRGEKPKGLPVKSFRPIFFKSIDSELPSGSSYCSVNLSELTIPEFKTLIGLDLVRRQNDDIEYLFQQIKQGNARDMDDLIIVASYFKSDKILKRLKTLNNYDLFNPEHYINPVDIIKQGYIPSLNYLSFESIDEHILQAFFFIWLRKLRRARHDNEIPELFLFIDETRLWLGKNAGKLIKDEIEKGLKLDRAKGISYFFAIQDVEDVSDGVFRQINNIFVTGRADRDMLGKILIKKQIIRNTSFEATPLQRLSDLFKKTPYSWLHVTDDMENIRNIKPLAQLVIKPYFPFCKHT